MITFFFFLVFLAGFTYQHARRPQKPNTPFYKHIGIPLIVLGILIVPIFSINLQPSEGRSLSLEEYLEYIEEHNTPSDQKKFYEQYMIRHPQNIEIRFKYIELIADNNYLNDGTMLEYNYSSNHFIQHQSAAYAEAMLYPDDSVKANPLKDQKYSNYIRAIEKINQNKYFLAKLYLYQEIDVNPGYKKARFELLKLTNNYYPDEYQKLLQKDKYLEILSFPTQRYIYYSNGQWGKYLKLITKESFVNVQLLPFIAALVISLIWLVFLRSLDVFNKEKWRDILIVFVIASASTHLCLFGYDLAHHELGLYINGGAINDFIYCTFVIGLSEETVKLIPWILFLLITRKAKEPYDYLLYASVSALGFAFVENFVYLENPGNITVRAIMSTVGHMFFASLVAYGFVLGRYKAKTTLMKWIFPIGGFIAGCFAHGFYDFWLISPFYKAFFIVTVIGFVFSVHIWMQFLNSALNNSPFYVARSFNPIIQLDLLSIGIVSVLILEYGLMNYHYGTDQANLGILKDGWIVPVFLTYLTTLFMEFKLVRGRWKKIRFDWRRGLNLLGRFGKAPHSSSDSYESYEGLQLRLFVSKTNRFVADKFPVSGQCQGFITVSGVDNWTLFKIDSKFSYPGYKNDLVIIRAKFPGESLQTDKVEIILLFIPVGIDVDDNLTTEQLRFTGKAFARPI